MKTRLIYPLIFIATATFGMAAHADVYVIHGARVTAPESSTVQVTGTVVEKDGNYVIVNYAGGDVRVHVPNTVQWYETYKRRPIEGLNVGTPVTIYGKLERSRDVPKIEADAIYFPEYDRLFFSDARKQLMMGEHVRDRLQEVYVPLT